MTGRLGADVGQTMFKTRHSFQRWSVDALEPFMFFMLVKNVYVGDRTLRAMYAEGLTEYRALKAELDPAGLFSSRLLDRLLGERVSDP